MVARRIVVCCDHQNDMFVFDRVPFLQKSMLTSNWAALAHTPGAIASRGHREVALALGLSPQKPTRNAWTPAPFSLRRLASPCQRFPQWQRRSLLPSRVKRDFQGDTRAGGKIFHQRARGIVLVPGISDNGRASDHRVAGALRGRTPPRRKIAQSYPSPRG
jgi:hypothetical protein